MPSEGSLFERPSSNVPLSGGTPMKRIPILLAVLLALAASSKADTIRITSGTGKIYPFMVLPGFTFQFHGDGYDIFIPGAVDEFGGTLVNCFPACDINHLTSFPALFIAGNILTPGNLYFAGGMRFDAVSFVSSLAPNGVLTIKYTATLGLNLFLFDSVNGTQVGPFVWGNPNQLWSITAQFAPDGSGLPGVYTFTGATLTSVPEPATVMLLGAGMLPVLCGVRRRCKSNILKDGLIPVLHAVSKKIRRSSQPAF
jgi:hypothetical protein